MTTPAQLGALCLLDAGIIGQGQHATAEDTNNWLFRVNMMIDQWARKRWMVYHLVDISVVSTGAQSYTIGPGQDYDVNPTRPDKIESAFLRQLNTGIPVDYPLEILSAREDYNRIRLKTLMSFPGSVFYDTDWPIGTIYPWPIPLASIYEVHLSIKQPFSEFADLDTDIDFPPEYEEAIYANSIVRLRAAYQLPPDPIMIGLAKATMNTIRQANAQVPRMVMPGAVTRYGPWYNILGDQP